MAVKDGSGPRPVAQSAKRHFLSRLETSFKPSMCWLPPRLLSSGTARVQGRCRRVKTPRQWRTDKSCCSHALPRIGVGGYIIYIILHIYIYIYIYIFKFWAGMNWYGLVDVLLPALWHRSWYWQRNGRWKCFYHCAQCGRKLRVRLWGDFSGANFG